MTLAKEQHDWVKEKAKRLGSPIASHDQKLRSLQTALDQVIENRAPGFGAFSAHALDRKQQLLAVRAHAEHDKCSEKVLTCKAGVSTRDRLHGLP